MKKALLISMIVFSNMIFSQDIITYKNGGKVYNSDNVKLSPIEVRSLLSTNEKALSLYNSGRTKKTVGNVLIYGGISTLIIKHISMINKHKIKNNQNFTANTNNIMYFVGAGMVLTAIPIKIGYSNKIKKSISLINEDLKNQSTGFNIESTSIIANSNGIGISITF